MNWSSPKHVQPEEGRKEPAPRAIRFRKSRVETTIRERAGSSQEGRKRAKDTPGYFLCFFFLFIPNSRCSRQKSSRHGRDESRQESPMVQNRERQPHNQLRLFVPVAPTLFATKSSSREVLVKKSSSKIPSKKQEM